MIGDSLASSLGEVSLLALNVNVALSGSGRSRNRGTVPSITSEPHTFHETTAESTHSFTAPTATSSRQKASLLVGSSAVTPLEPTVTLISSTFEKGEYAMSSEAPSDQTTRENIKPTSPSAVIELDSDTPACTMPPNKY